MEMNELNNLNNNIKEKELSINNLRLNLEELNLNIKKLRYFLIQNIYLERDEKGKLIFSNEKTREAELFLRLNNNDEYLNLKSDYSSGKNKINIELIELDFLKRKFEILRLG